MQFIWINRDRLSCDTCVVGAMAASQALILAVDSGLLLMNCQGLELLYQHKFYVQYLFALFNVLMHAAQAVYWTFASCLKPNYTRSWPIPLKIIGCVVELGAVFMCIWGFIAVYGTYSYTLYTIQNNQDRLVANSFTALLIMTWTRLIAYLCVVFLLYTVTFILYHRRAERATRRRPRHN